MGHDERSAQFTPNKTDPLTASDYKQPPIAIAVDVRNLRETEEISGTLQAKKTGGYSLNYQNPVRINNNFYTRQSISEFKETGTASALKARDYKDYTDVVTANKSIRRLTPTEAERLQGLPDGYTDIWYKGKPAPDSKRYKALGNGMAQPCADWVIKRIAEVCSQGIVKEHEFRQGFSQR
jgi:DNA (cytosine-5)-methyltransferase 1